MSKFGSAMRRKPPDEGIAAPGRGRLSSSFYAIAAGYLGLFSMFPFVGPFAVVFGVIALFDLERHPDLRGAWRAKLGIAAGALGTLAYAALWLRAKLG